MANIELDNPRDNCYESFQTAGSDKLLPKIMQNLKTKKLALTHWESEFMGLKYHLGHTGYVRWLENVYAGGSIDNGKSKMYLTKSSIQLTRLADLAQITNNIETKLALLREPALE